jgi:hypothetical protein
MTFSHAQAQQCGLTDRPLYRLLRIGRVELIGRGLYRRTDAPLPSDDDLLEIAHKTPDATLCLTSALACHGLSDAIPAAYDIAIPRGRYKPIVRAPVSWHTFDPATFDIGRTLLPIDAESSIGLYDPKRSIIDAFRLRRLEGPELGIEALKRWLRRRGSSPGELLACAESFPSAQRALEETLVILL